MVLTMVLVKYTWQTTKSLWWKNMTSTGNKSIPLWACVSTPCVHLAVKGCECCTIHVCQSWCCAQRLLGVVCNTWLISCIIFLAIACFKSERTFDFLNTVCIHSNSATKHYYTSTAHVTLISNQTKDVCVIKLNTHLLQWQWLQHHVALALLNHCMWLDLSLLNAARFVCECVCVCVCPDLSNRKQSAQLLLVWTSTWLIQQQ